MCPIYYILIVNIIRIIHEHVVGNALYVPRPMIELFRQSFQYNAPVLYSNLYYQTMSSKSLNSFKSNLK